MPDEALTRRMQILAVFGPPKLYLLLFLDSIPAMVTRKYWDSKRFFK